MLELRQHPDKQVLASLLGIRCRGRRSWIWRRGRTALRSCCRHPCLFWSSSHHCRNLAGTGISAIHCTAQLFTTKKQLLPKKPSLKGYGTEFLHEWKMCECQDLLNKGLSISDNTSELKLLHACTSMFGF